MRDFKFTKQHPYPQTNESTFNFERPLSPLELTVLLGALTYFARQASYYGDARAFRARLNPLSVAKNPAIIDGIS